MKNCAWLKPELVAQIEFAEWTPDGHLRHYKFVGLREDKARGTLKASIRHDPPASHCLEGMAKIETTDVPDRMATIVLQQSSYLRAKHQVVY